MAVISGGSGAKKTVSVAKTSPPPPRPAQTWTFRGRVFTSYAAYLNAVEAFNRQIQQQRAAELARKRDAAVATARNRAAADARNALADNQARLREEALMREQKRIAASRKAELEAIVAKRRREAWIALQRRQQQVLRKLHERQAQIDADRVTDGRQESEAKRLIRLSQVRDARGGVLEGTEKGSVEDRERTRVLQRLANGGSFVEELAKVNRTSASTGGRYVDRKLLESITSQYLKQLNDVRQPFEQQSAEISALAEAGEYDKALALYDAPDFQQLYQQFIKLFGQAGATPVAGEAEGFMRIYNEIAERRDSWLTRAVLGPQVVGRVLTPTELEEQKKNLERTLTVRDVRGGHLKGEERNTPRVQNLDEWLRRQSEIEFNRARENQTRASDLRRQLRSVPEGVDPTGGVFFERGSDGNLYLRDIGRTKQKAQFEALYRSGGLSEEQVRQLQDDVNNGTPAARENAQRELFRAASAGFDRQYGRYFMGGDNQTFLRSGGTVQRRNLSLLQSLREDFKLRLQRELRITDEAITGPAGFLQDVMFAPVSGEILSGLGVAAGGVGTLFKAVFGAATGGGQLQVGGSGNLIQKAQSGVGFNELVGQIGSLGVDFSKREEFVQQVQDLLASIGSTDENLPNKLTAISNFGNDAIGGHLGFAAAGLAFDPLNFIPAARYLKSGRVQIARAGGFRASLRNAGSNAAEALRLANPRNADEFKDLSNMLWLHQKSKVPMAQIEAMSGGDLAKLAREALEQTPQELKKKGLWGKAFETDPVNAQQLLVAVQSEAKRIAAGELIRSVSANEMEDAIRFSRQQLARAEREAETIALQTAREAKERAGAEALEMVRIEREVGGGPIAPKLDRGSVAIAPDVLVRRSRFANRYRAAVADRVRIATEAVEAARLLEDSKFPKLRMRTQRRLQSAVRELRKFEDQRRVIDTQGNEEIVPGILSRRRAALEEFERRTGSGQRPPRFLDIDAKRVASDAVYLRKALIAARQRALGGSGYWKSRVQQLEQAVEFLEVEKRLVGGAKHTTRQVVASYGDQAKDLINLNRVTGRAVTPEAGIEEFGRDIYRRVRAAEVYNSAPVPARVENEARSLVSQLKAVNLSKVAGFEELADLFGDVNLWEFGYAVYRASKENFELYEDTLRWVENSIESMGILTRDLNRPDALFDTFEQLRTPLTNDVIGTYRHADDVVTKMMHDVRGWQAKGQITVRRAKPGARRTLVPRRDAVVAEVIGKLRVLDAQGLDLGAYDDLRAALGDLNLKYNRGESLRTRAQRLARRSGRTVEEEFDALREAARGEEVVQQIERFASQPEMLGRSAGEVYNMFEATFLDRDLLPQTKLSMNEYTYRALRRSFAELSGVRNPDDLDAARAWLTRTNAPPLGNRAEMRQWLVDNHHWTPRTGEDIRAGKRVWSIDDERAFWESSYGFTPEWTKPEVLKTLLDSPEAYHAKFREWGFFDDDFEQLASGLHVSPEERAGQIVWGAEGIQRARTYEELRSWFIARYGKLVSDDGETLIRVPWLMDAQKTEYRNWWARMVSDGYDNPALADELGIEIDRSLVRKEEMLQFSYAVTDTVRRRIDRMLRDGTLEKGADWLPQERLQFAYDVVNELMLDPVWRGFLRKKAPAARFFDSVGWFFRLPMVMTIAFPVMNLIDSYGLKRFLLTMIENHGLPLSTVRAEIRERIPDLETLHAKRNATWYLREANGFSIAADSELAARVRAKGLLRGVNELPLRVSKLGEDRLRLDFGRAMYQDMYDSLVRRGATDEVAHARALAHARSRIDVYFPSIENASDFEIILNQLVPFFTYNVRNKALGIRIALSNPWVLAWADRIGREVEQLNREQWEREHPGERFPFTPAQARRFWIRVPGSDQTYTIDLSTFSDWTRGPKLLFSGGTPEEWFHEFIRVPHPSQAILWANLFGFNGGKTPFGTPTDWGDITLWFDLAKWFMEGGQDAFNPLDKNSLDTIQIWSQMLFFKAFGRLNPIQSKVQQYFAFMELDQERAFAYLNANPDLKAYFLLDGTRPRIDEPVTRWSWFRGKRDEVIEAFNAVYDEYQAIRRSYDAKIDDFYLTPYSPELRALKREKHAVLKAFVIAHPELSEFWGFYMSPADWAAGIDDYFTDLKVEHYFDMQDGGPRQSEYPTELAFAEAQQAHYAALARYLEANPDVYDALYRSKDAVKQAWIDQELHWSEILERQGALKIQRLKEEAAGGDPAIISFLHDVADLNYTALDAEAFAPFYDLIDGDMHIGQRSAVGELLSRALGRFQKQVILPGRQDHIFNVSSPERQAEIAGDEAYRAQINTLIDASNADGDFYGRLRDKPRLLEEYLRRNPGKRVSYQNYLDGERYYNEITALRARSTGPADFYRQLDANQWLSNQYYARHPEKRGNSAYIQRIGEIARAATSGADFFERLRKQPDLLREYLRRNPDKAAAYTAGAEYVAAIKPWGQAMQRGDYAEADRLWAAMPAWVKERYFETHGAADGQAVVDGQSYFAALGGWIELLKAKRYDEAETYFRSLPEWMREKYYQKHPDQRAKNEIDNAALAAGARYFLAQDADKRAELARNPQLAEFLRVHGGNEGAMRGLILAIYRAIPSREPWLKRTFRLRYPEIFGKEAQGERRLAKVARELAEHPEIEPFYQRALALQTKLYTEQLKRSKVAPKPLSMERRRRWKKRSRNRSARFASHWRKHAEIRGR